MSFTDIPIRLRVGALFFLVTFLMFICSFLMRFVFEYNESSNERRNFRWLFVLLPNSLKTTPIFLFQFFTSIIFALLIQSILFDQELPDGNLSIYKSPENYFCALLFLVLCLLTIARVSLPILYKIKNQNHKCNEENLNEYLNFYSNATGLYKITGKITHITFKTFLMLFYASIAINIIYRFILK